MKVGKLLFLILILMLTGVLCVFAAEREKIRCNVGYSIKSIADVDTRDAEAALRVWAREMADPFGFEVEATLYESVDKLITDFLDKKLDFIMINSVEYLRTPTLNKAKPEMTRVRSNKTTVKYVLLTQAQGNSKGLTGLKNKNLSIAKVNHLGLTFVSVQLMQAGLPDAERFFSTIQYKTKESQAILAVFFGQAEACLVSDTAFNTMKELNPQVGQKLRILAESPELIETVGFFRKDYPLSHKERLIKGMKGGIKSHERGKQIMLLFNVDYLDVIKEGEFDSARKLLADYDRLKKRK